MNYKLNIGSTTKVYSKLDTAIYYAIDFIAHLLFNIEGEIEFGTKVEHFLLEDFYILVDLISEKRYKEAIGYYNLRYNMKIRIAETSQCGSIILKSNYTLNNYLIQLANKIKKEMVFS